MTKWMAFVCLVLVFIAGQAIAEDAFDYADHSVITTSTQADDGPGFLMELYVTPTGVALPSGVTVYAEDKTDADAAGSGTSLYPVTYINFSSADATWGRAFRPPLPLPYYNGLYIHIDGNAAVAVRKRSMIGGIGNYK